MNYLCFHTCCQTMARCSMLVVATKYVHPCHSRNRTNYNNVNTHPPLSRALTTASSSTPGPLPFALVFGIIRISFFKGRSAEYSVLHHTFPHIDGDSDDFGMCSVTVAQSDYCILNEPNDQCTDCLYPPLPIRYGPQSTRRLCPSQHRALHFPALIPMLSQRVQNLLQRNHKRYGPTLWPPPQMQSSQSPWPSDTSDHAHCSPENVPILHRGLPAVGSTK